jgi:hypothetical protein
LIPQLSNYGFNSASQSEWLSQESAYHPRAHHPFELV